MQVEAGKKELVYYKEVNTDILMQELYANIPAVQPAISSDGRIIANLRVFVSAGKVILWVPIDVLDNEVQDIVNTHIAEFNYTIQGVNTDGESNIS